MHKFFRFCAGLVFSVLTQVAVAETGDPIDVFVSILPQKYLVERIGAGRVNVTVMVRAGLNPETYEPTPRQMSNLARADVYFRIAVPFESLWMDKIKALNPGLKIIDCCGMLLSDKLAQEETAAGVNILHDDAHVWTSPANAAVLAEIITTSLSAIDPGHSDYFSANHRKLVQDLDDLDEFVRRELATLVNRYLLVAHPSWGHFARAYQLLQIPIERHGTEVRARELTRLIDFARDKNIHAVYVQKQVNSSVAEMLAREINARIIDLDPLAEDYINNLRLVTHEIKSGAGQP